LAENVALTDEQRRDDENHLVAAAHGQGGGTNPAKHAWMRRRRTDGLRYGTHFDAAPEASRVAPAV
jgi:hypothetical protein